MLFILSSIAYFISLTSATSEAPAFVFDSNPLVISNSGNVGVRLWNAPTSNVVLYFESAALKFNTCAFLTFTSLNWNVYQSISVSVAQPVICTDKDVTKSYSINFKSYSCDLKYKEKTQSLSVNQLIKACRPCSGYGDPHFKTLNMKQIEYDSKHTGLYQMIDSDPLSVVLNLENCHVEKATCISQMFMRYGSTKVTVDLIAQSDKYQPVVSGVDNTVASVAQGTVDSKGKQMFKITFGGSYALIRISRYSDTHKYLDVYFFLESDYEKSVKGGLCNNFKNQNVLIGKDGKPYNPSTPKDVDTFVTSWKGTDVNSMLGSQTSGISVFYKETCALPSIPPFLNCASTSSSTTTTTTTTSSIVPTTSSSVDYPTTSSSFSSTTSSLSSTTITTSSDTTTTSVPSYETSSSIDSEPQTTNSEYYTTTEDAPKTTTSCTPSPSTTDSSIYISGGTRQVMSLGGIFGFIFVFVF